MGGSQVQKAGSVNSEMLCLSPCKRKQQPVDQKGRGAEPCEREGNTGQNSEVPRLRQESKRSLEAKGCCRQKGSPWQRSGVSSCRSYQGRGPLEETRRAGPPSSRERPRANKAESTGAKAHWPRDPRHTKARVQDTRPHPRSPVRSLKRRRPGDTRAEPHSCPKRHRQHGPEGRPSRALSPLASVMTRMGALEVALEELQAPGGAILPGHSRGAGGGGRGGTEEEEEEQEQDMVSQRAWLTWQLSHAGAALHWALHTVNSILAEQACMARYT